MVIASPSRRIRKSFASAADFATLAMPIVSNAWPIGGIGPPGRRLFCTQRVSSSVVPVHPGISPTPASTRPM